MDQQEPKKTGAIIGTVAAILLCGLPGLCGLCPVSIWIFTGTFPDFTGNYYYLPGTWGILPLCLSVLAIAVAVLVPVLTLRKKKPKEEIAASIPPTDPLPPAS